MHPLQSLIREHQIISGVVNALEIFARQLERRTRPRELSPESFDLAGFVQVFTDLAECIHHEKEENILLPLLSRHGFDWKSQTLSAVRDEHRQETYLIDVLRQASERPSTWSLAEESHIAASARALVDFQRAHHQLENTKLFPEVMARLDAAALDEVRGAFDKFDREHRTRRDAAIALAEELSARYAPTSASPTRAPANDTELASAK